jgi:hypothetical protein
VKNFGVRPLPQLRKWVWLRLYHRQNFEMGCELGMCVEALIRHILPEPDDEEYRAEKYEEELMKKWRRS